jgi:hypothetical protein
MLESNQDCDISSQTLSPDKDVLKKNLCLVQADSTKYRLKNVYIVIRFVWVSGKFVTCNVVSVKETLVEAKMRIFTLESTHFIFNKCPIYTHDGASAKFSTNSHGTD